MASGTSDMDLNDLLEKARIDPRRVLVLRHRPSEPEFHKVLPWLAVEKPDVFNAYQQTQTAKVEKAMGNAEYVASFIGREPAKALFIGIYKVGPSKPLTYAEYWATPAYVEMKTFGMKGWTRDDNRSSILWFDLATTERYGQWKGKLIIEWPPPERSWWRWAHRNKMRILAVLEDSALDAAMPDWDRLVITWEELRVLPTRWKSALSQWRGIYYVFDLSDGKGYVGSAYGAENLLGRWLNYAASGHGGNMLLRQRNPQNLQFSVLQRVSPDLDADDVIRLEATWKERLHTRPPGGLNDN